MTQDPKGSSKARLLQAVHIISFLVSEETSVIHTQSAYTNTNTHSFTLFLRFFVFPCCFLFSASFHIILYLHFPLILPRGRGRCVVGEHLHHQCNSNYFIDIPCLITLLWIICINLFPFFEPWTQTDVCNLVGLVSLQHTLCLPLGSPLSFSACLCLSLPTHNPMRVCYTMVANQHWASFTYVFLSWFLQFVFKRNLSQIHDVFLNHRFARTFIPILMNPIVLVNWKSIVVVPM